MPPPNVMFCPVHLSICASQNIVNTISCRVVDTFSLNLHQRCIMGWRWTPRSLGSKGQGHSGDFKINAFVSRKPVITYCWCRYVSVPSVLNTALSHSLTVFELIHYPNYKFSRVTRIKEW